MATFEAKPLLRYRAAVWLGIIAYLSAEAHLPRCRQTPILV